MMKKTISFAGIEFIMIPAGAFIMGSDEIDDDEGAAQPQHRLTLSNNFYIARYPVTNLQFARATKGMRFSAEEAQYPIVGTSWFQAQAYIKWLNERYQTEVPTDHRFSLPSEAEWEKAARGTDGHVYPWGNEFSDKLCNAAHGGFGRPSAVGYYSPNGDSSYGAADMAGNIWEWTRSLWGREFERTAFKYPYDPNDGREEDADQSVLRVLRGGSFADPPENARCAVRYAEEPGRRFGNIGFRVALIPT